ncbi:MAG: hypothetical protein H7836_04025 [Magnetococcus sp. YQC-3]
MNSRANSSWITVHLPWMGPEQVAAFVDNLPFLFRLNPFLRLDHWQAEPIPLQNGWSAEIKFLNEMNGLAATRRITLESLPQGWRVHYGSGLKACLEITWQPHATVGSQLTLEEVYHPLPDGQEREILAREVDHSLLPWGAAVRRHLLWQSRLGWCPPVRWYLQWLPSLTPSQRRITRLLLWSTLLEMVLLCGMLFFLRLADVAL